MTRRIGALLFALLLVASAAQANDQQCDQVGENLPAATAAEVGVSAELLANLLDDFDAAGHDIRSLLVLRDCRLVLERYRRDLDRDHHHAVYSVTKSLTATLVGILQHQGKLDSGALDQPIAALIPKPGSMPQSSWDKAQQISLRNAMQMASGIEYKHDPSGHPIYQLRIDRLMVALRPPITAKPGTHFQYSDGDATLTGAVVAAAAGMPLYDAAKKLLFAPLNMRSHDWLYVDMAGRYPGGWGLRLRPMDMLKLGQLYLQDCVWNSLRLCDSAFLKAAWEPSAASKAYGLHWWRDSRDGQPYFAGRGFKGQLLLVFPAQRTVVAMTAVIPPRDINKVEGQIAHTVMEMPGAYRATLRSGVGPSQSRLERLQAAGFNGETRRSVTSQDTPLK